ncbi:hypothetical protein C7E17_27305, partial [Stenotrophomonas maltophilia]
SRAAMQQGLAPGVIGRFGGQCIQLLLVLGQVEFWPSRAAMQQGLAPGVIGRFGGQCIQLLLVLGQVEF